MNTVSVGPWELDVPVDWQHQDGRGVPYFESEDGKNGCYIKAIAFGNAHQSRDEAASYLQEVHKRNFLADPEANWKAVAHEVAQVGGLTRSLLDLLNSESKYRVLSVVLATEREAIQVSIHDYYCEDYAHSKEAFASVADSVRRARSEV